MKKFRDSFQSKISDEFFGMKVKFALRKQYLSDTFIGDFKYDALWVYNRHYHKQSS